MMLRELLLGVCLISGSAGATTCVPDRLPASEFADTESTTNCPFAFGQQGAKNFQFDMTFAGTASNNVQLAFGRDANADGVLSAEETDLVFAWECGTWRLEGIGAEDAENCFSCPAGTEGGLKELHWDLRLSRRRPKRLSLAENGVTIFPALAENPQPWFYGTDWNIFRLTARGVDAPEEGVRVNLNVEGCVFILR